MCVCLRVTVTVYVCVFYIHMCVVMACVEVCVFVHNF